MFGRFFKREQAPVLTPLPPEPPEGCAIWAIGDIHGRLDLLKVLLNGIIKDLNASKADRKVVIFLGDYIDRGPDSSGVLDHLCAFEDATPLETYFLKGNHEDKLLQFLDDPQVGPQWCEYGGGQALQSFGLTPPMMAYRSEGWAAVSADLSHRLKPRQRRFLTDLITHVSLGGYFFAHAGARPGVTLSAQTETDLLWIRGSFLNSPERFEQVVVHGHTPARDVHIDARRIGLDTRAYESGVLSAIRLQGREQRILQVVESADGIRLQTP